MVRLLYDMDFVVFGRRRNTANEKPEVDFISIWLNSQIYKGASKTGQFAPKT